MLKFSKYLYKIMLLLELVALVFMVSICQPRSKDRAEKEQQVLKHTRDAVHVTEDSSPDFSSWLSYLNRLFL